MALGTLFDTVKHDVLWEVLKDQGLLKVCVKQGRATWRSEGVDAKVQTDRPVRSPASMQATVGIESADYAVAPMADPNSGWDTTVLHNFYEN